jgi:Calcineurin-like phosphoesterase
MGRATYLIFGDLHGRVLPAFRMALVWQREHGETVDGILQVGDMGFFPDPNHLDRSTRKHSRDDPLELGARLVAFPSPEADAVFDNSEAQATMWFTAGNHEDFAALEELRHAPGCTADDFPVDYYGRLRLIRDGAVREQLPGGLRVGALWGIDDQAPRARRRTAPAARLRLRSADRLMARTFDVLLTHESPRDLMQAEAGSDAITALIRHVRPPFAFFGHYHEYTPPEGWKIGTTNVYHLRGLEFRGRGHTAEDKAMGVLRWDDQNSQFQYASAVWLRSFNRDNWEWR